VAGSEFIHADITEPMSQWARAGRPATRPLAGPLSPEGAETCEHGRMGAADIRRAKKLQDVVEKFALSLPQAWTDTPWDESHVSKVRKKIFAFHGSAEEPGLSVKLTASLDHALTLRGAARMG
jgi:hypothetical protein